jgi:hypothetical protein
MLAVFHVAAGLLGRASEVSLSRGVVVEYVVTGIVALSVLLVVVTRLR